MARSNFTAELCQHHNNTVALPGFVCPNPITRPFDTETDSDPDPDFASPLTSSDGIQLEVVRKGLRIRMGRDPAEIAEIAEGAEVYWEGGKGTHIGAVFNNCLGQLNRYH
jgi:hypothetical protein